MFDLRGFLKRGFFDAVGKMPTYKIVLNAAGWLEKGVLLEEDLAEVQTAIEQAEASGLDSSAFKEITQEEYNEFFPSDDGEFVQEETEEFTEERLNEE